MPLLSLSNSLSKAYNRVTTICIDNDFGSSHSFTGTNASVALVSDKLSVTDSGSGGGYASRSFATHIGTTYSYSISFDAGSAGHLKIGTSGDDGTHVNTAVSGGGDPGYGVRDGTFTATTTTTHITLRVTSASANQRWDNLVIQEDN